MAAAVGEHQALNRTWVVPIEAGQEKPGDLVFGGSGTAPTSLVALTMWALLST